MEIRAFSPVARVSAPTPTPAIDPPVADKGLTFRRADPSRQARMAPDANSLQGMLAQIASRPSQLRRVLKSLGDEAAGDFARLSDEAASHVKAGGSLADYAQRKSLDPASLQLIGTKAALDRDTSDPTLSQMLRHELEQLQDRLGSQISATLNTAAAIQTLQRPAADKAWLRGMYLTVVSASVPVMDAFESLLQKFGANAFEKGALAMLRALSDDMNAPRSSVAPDRLQMLLLSSMVTIRHLLALIHTCRAFLRQPAVIHDSRRTVEAVHQGQSDSQQDSPDTDEGDTADQERQQADQTTLRMVKLVLQLIGSSAAVKMVPRFLEEEVMPAAQVERAARVRNEFIDMVRALPPSLWKESKQKDQLIDMLRRQAMTDTSVSS
jgi:type III secretion system YopN/LcrE/InvE/MxiC family regulator